MWKTMASASLALACLALPAHGQTPDRTVSGTSVTSTHDPKIRIDLPASAQYVGADRWLLLGFDDCEMHLFVDADADKHIQRLYWVQFEAYIPERPDMHHDYSGSRHITINGLDFYLDTWVQDASQPAEKTRTANTSDACSPRRAMPDQPMACMCGWSICPTRKNARS